MLKQSNLIKPLLLSLTAAVCLASGISVAQAQAGKSNDVVNPHSPRYGNPHRHGVVPTRETHEKMKAWRAANGGAATAAAAATGTQTLSFGGGINGIGVTSGTPKVYLVFWGSQWGTQGTDASGNATFTGDTKGAAPYMQKWIKGLGTNGELWSGTFTQYCDGPLVASGAVTCPAAAPHVGYPGNGTTLAGVWYVNTAAAPAQATGKQIAQVAIDAAAHFGNTTAASNRYVQYVIMSPTGTKPDGFNTPSGGFCAWHDYTGDTTLSGGAVTSPYGDIAFTNMPYVTDAGTSCGQNFVNAGAAGTLDGFSLVGGHEYGETITDQNPAGGWTNHTGSTYNGQENADECSWISTGQGASANVTFATGTFAMQSSWSNDTNRCDLTHPIVTGGTATGGTPVANFTFTTSGLTATFTDTSTDTGGTIGSRSWNFGDATSSTLANPSHTYAAAGTYSVSETVTDSVNGTSSTKTASVTVTATGGSTQLLGNTGFETGTAAPWTLTTGVLCSTTTCTTQSPRAGTWYAYLNGYGSTHTDSAIQTVTIPAGKTSASLSFYLKIVTKETTTTTAYDKLAVQVLNSAGTVLGTLATYSNLNASTGYVLKTLSMNAYIGQTVKIKFLGTEDASLSTSFLLDDVTLTVQ